MTATTPAVLHNFIDNTFVEPAEGAREEVLSPATSTAIAEARGMATAASSPREAFARWSRTTPGERARALLAIANAMDDDQAQELAVIESREALTSQGRRGRGSLWH